MTQGQPEALRITELEAKVAEGKRLLREEMERANRYAALAADFKLRAEQMEQRLDMANKLGNEAREQLASLKAAPAAALTDEQIDAVFERMPGGAQGFLKSFGYRQFAREIEALIPAAPAAQAVEEGVGAILGAAYDFRDAHLSGSMNLKRSAHASLESVVRAALRATPPAQALADAVQEVFDALQDKIDTKGPIAKSNLQFYVNMLREAFNAAPQAQDVQDAGLIDWLGKQYIGPDFRWGDPATEVVVIEMPKGCSYCGDFKTDMHTAIAASAAKGGA